MIFNVHPKIADAVPSWTYANHLFLPSTERPP